MKKFVFALAAALFVAVSAGAEGVGEWFFKNNISNDARLIDIHILGAHDAFTAGLNENSDQDDAGIKLGDSGAVSSAHGENGEYDFFWKSLVLKMSRAQSADVDTLLNNGVRYFDIRLSRYKQGGEFYTVHGRVSDQFTGEGGIARKIAAWAGTHPGELIVLDFQSLFDIETGNGGATQQSWKDLMSKLSSDGVAQYVHTSNGDIASVTYGSLTSNGSRPAIVLFGQVTGAAADNRFINRGPVKEPEDGLDPYKEKGDGYILSYWTKKSNYADMRAALADEIDYIKSNSNKFYYRLRIMQAQTTSLDLINDADANNIKILTDKDFDAWSNLLPVLMVDNAATAAGDFNAKAVELLAKKNREYTPGVYSAADGAVTLTGSNDNIPLGAAFSAKQNGDSLELSLSEGALGGEMELIIRSGGKRQRLYRGGELLGETGADGLLKAKVTELGEFTLTDTGEAVPEAAPLPLVRYGFSGEAPLADISGSGLDAVPIGSPVVGGGMASLTPGNVLGLPVGLTKHIKAYTVSAWVKLNEGCKNDARLFDIGRHQRASVFANATPNLTTSSIKNNSDTSIKTANAKGAGLGSEWTHIAASYSGGHLRLYINGVQAAEEYADPSVHPSPETINDYFNPHGSFIGRTMWYAFNESANANPDINADIADFRIYAEALSADTVKRLGTKPTAKFIDILTGEEIKSPVLIEIEKAYDSYSFPEKIGEYTLVRSENIADMAACPEAVGYYTNMADSLTLTRDGGVVKAEAVINKLVPNLRLFVAAYNDGNEVVEIKSAPMEGHSISVEIEAADSLRVRAFLWDKSTLRPLFVSEEAAE